MIRSQILASSNCEVAAPASGQEVIQEESADQLETISLRD